MSFEKTWLNEFLFRESYDHAAELRTAPGKSANIAAIRDQNNDPYTVRIKSYGYVTCSCKMFSTRHLCSHKLAVADRQNLLQQLLAWYVSVNQGSSFT